MRDNAYTTIGLTCDGGQLFQCRNDTFEAFFVQRSKTLVDEKDVDIHIGFVERGEGQREGQRHHKPFTAGQHSGTADGIFVVTVYHQYGEFLVLFATGQFITVGNLFEEDIGVVEQGSQDIGLGQSPETGSAKMAIDKVPTVEAKRDLVQLGTGLG